MRVRCACAVAPATSITVGVMHKPALSIRFTLRLSFSQSPGPPAVVADSPHESVGLARPGYKADSTQTNGRGTVEKKPRLTATFTSRTRDLENSEHVERAGGVAPLIHVHPGGGLTGRSSTTFVRWLVGSCKNSRTDN